MRFWLTLLNALQARLDIEKFFIVAWVFALDFHFTAERPLVALVGNFRCDNILTAPLATLLIRSEDCSDARSSPWARPRAATARSETNEKIVSARDQAASYSDRTNPPTLKLTFED